MKNRYLTSILVILSLISLSFGASSVTLFSLLREPSKAMFIILSTRIPRLIALIISAIGLSFSGLIFQQISKNKFVSPTTASTLDGAKLGLALALVFFANSSIFTKAIISFIFALITTCIFIGLSKNIKGKSHIYIPLIGIMLGSFINSITIFISYQYDIIQSISTWFYGDFSKIIIGQYELLYLAIPLLILAYFYTNKFTIASMGEDFSTNLGLNYRKVVNVGLVIISMLSSVIIIIVGSIPFLGLIIPNIVSIYFGDNLKKNISKIFLIASIFLITCDIFSRIIRYPYELPIGLIVGVFGAIIFLYLIFKEQKC